MNFAAFDLNLLRVFDALMREKSATRAGDRVGLSQPAVSAALGRLRHALGDELFIRQGNEMVPTPRATALAGPLHDALVTLEQALYGSARFDPAAAVRDFRLMGADFLATHLIPDLARHLATAAPGISLRFLDSARGDVDSLLVNDAIDMALERPLDLPDWIARTLLFRSPFVIIAAKSNKALKKAGIKEGAAIPLDLFCDLPHALRSIDGTTTGFIADALAKVGKKRRVVLTLAQFHALGLAIAGSDLIAAVPVQFARAVAQDLCLAIYEPPMAVPVPDISLYWHRRHDQDPAHRWLREQIVAAAAPLTV